MLWFLLMSLINEQPLERQDDNIFEINEINEFDEIDSASDTSFEVSDIVLPYSNSNFRFALF